MTHIRQNGPAGPEDPYIMVCLQQMVANEGGRWKKHASKFRTFAQPHTVLSGRVFRSGDIVYISEMTEQKSTLGQGKTIARLAPLQSPVGCP